MQRTERGQDEPPPRPRPRQTHRPPLQPERIARTNSNHPARGTVHVAFEDPIRVRTDTSIPHPASPPLRTSSPPPRPPAPGPTRRTRSPSPDHHRVTLVRQNSHPNNDGVTRRATIRYDPSHHHHHQHHHSEHHHGNYHESDWPNLNILYFRRARGMVDLDCFRVAKQKVLVANVESDYDEIWNELEIFQNGQEAKRTKARMIATQEEDRQRRREEERKSMKNVEARREQQEEIRSREDQRRTDEDRRRREEDEWWATQETQHAADEPRTNIRIRVRESDDEPEESREHVIIRATGDNRGPAVWEQTLQRREEQRARRRVEDRQRQAEDMRRKREDQEWRAGEKRQQAARGDTEREKAAARDRCCELVADKLDDFVTLTELRLKAEILANERSKLTTRSYHHVSGREANQKERRESKESREQIYNPNPGSIAGMHPHGKERETAHIGFFKLRNNEKDQLKPILHTMYPVNKNENDAWLVQEMRKWHRDRTRWKWIRNLMMRLTFARLVRCERDLKEVPIRDPEYLRSDHRQARGGWEITAAQNLIPFEGPSSYVSFHWMMKHTDDPTFEWINKIETLVKQVPEEREVIICILLYEWFDLRRVAIFAFLVILLAIGCGVAFALWQNDLQSGLGVSGSMFMFIGFSSGLYGFDNENGLFEKPRTWSWAYDSKFRHEVEEDETNSLKNGYV